MAALAPLRLRLRPSAAGRAPLPCLCAIRLASSSSIVHLQQGSKVAAVARAPSAAVVRPGRRSRQLAARAVAMVNVDFASPSLVLGAALIASGVVLLQLRSFQNKISRDADIVVAAMVSIVGSTLIFQGWRLDPLLLLCQALTTSVAVWYGMETFRLRSKEQDLLQQQARELPPPEDDAAAQAFYASTSYQPQQGYYQQQQQQAGSPMPGAYPGAPAPPGTPGLPPGQEYYMPWAAQAPMQQQPMIRYDYYGNPIEPAVYSEQYDVAQAAVQQQYGNEAGASPYGGMGAPQQPQDVYGMGASASAGGYGGYDGAGDVGPGPAQQGDPYAPPQPGPSATGAGGYYSDLGTAAAYGAGYAAGPSGYGGYDSTASAGAAGPGGASSPVLPSAGAGRANPRVDIYEKVDDWE